MKMRWQGIVAVATVVLAAGCQTSVHQVKVDRVDQDLAHGNRGYVVGKPPAEGERSATRDITELEVQLSSGQHPVPKRQAAVAAAPSADTAAAETTLLAAPESSTASTMNIMTSPAASAPSAPAAETAAPVSVHEYTVRTGDSLSRIAKKVYGNGRLWQRIYDANRDQLPNANKLRPGMVLKIPALDGTTAHSARHRRHQAHATTGPYVK